MAPTSTGKEEEGATEGGGAVTVIEGETEADEKDKADEGSDVEGCISNPRTTLCAAENCFDHLHIGYSIFDRRWYIAVIEHRL